MSAYQPLIEAAQNEVLAVQERIRIARRDLERLEAEAEQQRALVEELKKYQRSASDYKPKTGDDVICPACWARSGREVALRPIDSNLVDVDAFRCGECNSRYELKMT